MKKHLLSIGAGLAIGLLPATALADYDAVNQAVNAVGGMLPDLSSYGAGGLCDAVEGACGLAAIAAALLARFRPLLTIIGVLGISFAGLRMVIGQEDDTIGKSRAVMSASIAGIMLAYLIEPFLAAFYGTSGSVQKGGAAAGVAVLSTEVAGVIEWALTIAAVLSVLMIILSALKALQPGTATGEEGITGMRKTVISVVFGLILLVVRFALADSLVNNTASPQPALVMVAVIIGYIMAFFALAAVCMLIYAGVQLVVSWGNSDAMSRAKSILIRSVIGSIVFFLSLAIVRFIVEPGLT